MTYLILLLIGMLLWPNHAQGAQPVRIGVWSFNIIATMLLKEAQDRGFYERHGVRLEFEIVRRDADLVAGLRSGSLDVIPVAMGSGLPFAIAAGSPLRSVFVLTDYPDNYLVSKHTSLEAVQGKRIGSATSGTVLERVLSEALRERGVTAELVPFDLSGPRIAALRTGALDAAVVSLLYWTKLQSEGYTLLVSAEEMQPLSTYGLAVNAKDLQAPWVRGMVRGTLDALRWYHTDPEGARSMISRYGELTAEQASSAYTRSQAMVSRTGVLPESRIRAALRVLGVALEPHALFDFSWLQGDRR